MLEDTLEEARAHSLLGTAIGGYIVERFMARGGMGEVYEARHPHLNRRVAVKVLAADLASEDELVQRFFAEAQAVNVIRDKHIVDVIDLALLPDGRPYMMMEYLEGEVLSQRLKRTGPASLTDVGLIVLPVLDALDAAHSASIVHRDLKPDNIFVTMELGRITPKVLDFGIAKLLEKKGDTLGGFGQTTAGIVLGTPAYMAPEQAAGRPGEVDTRTDLYAVGVLIYRMLCSQNPFSAPTRAELLVKIESSPPPSPREIRPDISEELEALVLRALQKDRAKRFQSAREMGIALRAALADHGVPGASLPEPDPRALVARDVLARTLEMELTEPTVRGRDLKDTIRRTLEVPAIQLPPESEAGDALNNETGRTVRTAASEMVAAGQAPARKRWVLGVAVAAAVAAVLGVGVVGTANDWFSGGDSAAARRDDDTRSVKTTATESADPVEPREPETPEPEPMTPAPETAAVEPPGTASATSAAKGKRSSGKDPTKLVRKDRGPKPKEKRTATDADGPLTPEEMESLMGKKKAATAAPMPSID